MAKRTEEEPFRPLDTDLVKSVMAGSKSLVTESEPTTPQPRPPTSIELGRSNKPAESRVDAPNGSFKRLQTPEGASFSERLEREKRVLLTPSEERAVERVVANIGAELGTAIKFSHVLRSCMHLLVQAESELVDRAKARGRVIRPPNGNHPAIEEFERAIAAVIQAGLKDARSIR